MAQEYLRGKQRSYSETCKGMKYLSLEVVLTIHKQMVIKGGGADDIHDFGALLSAIELPKSGVVGQELYPNIESKASILLLNLVRNHPFVDGNKRTGYFSMHRFLYINRYKLDVTEDESFELVVGIAAGKYEFEYVFGWVSERISRID